MLLLASRLWFQKVTTNPITAKRIGLDTSEGDRLVAVTALPQSQKEARVLLVSPKLILVRHILMTDKAGLGSRTVQR